MGHPSVSSMKFLPDTMYHNFVLFNECNTCYLSKQKRLKFVDSISVSSILFELLHVDVWGPYKYKTHGNCNYFLTVFKDKSKTTWVSLFVDKTHVASLLLKFFAYVRSQFDCSVKI